MMPDVVIAQGATDPNKRVPMVNTPISREDLAYVLLEGHITELGGKPSLSRLAMGWAQVALENGNGKYSYNHNLGNIGPSKPDQSWYLSRLDGNFYKSFDTFEDAAETYWYQIQHCTGVLQQFDYGNATVAAAQLRGCGYFGADLKLYTKGMIDLYWTGRKFAKIALERWEKEHQTVDIEKAQ
jgi:hypothetical protein